MTANLTGASPLLLRVAVGLPAVVAVLPDRWRPERVGRIQLPKLHRIELAVLAVAALWSLRGVVGGKLTLLDSAVLIFLYGVYLRRVTVAGGDGPPPMGVAAQLGALPRSDRRRWVGGLMLFSALVILVTAVPFGNAVLGTGGLVGISAYVLLQWIVPLGTETPELVVAFVLLTHGRGGHSVAVLLAGAVSQYTLALGTLPIAYALGPAVGPLPLAPREQVELLLTISVALYAVAALVELRLSRADSTIMFGLFVAQFLLPAVSIRLAFAVIYATIAVDILVAERHQIPALLRVLRPRAGES